MINQTLNKLRAYLTEHPPSDDKFRVITRWLLVAWAFGMVLALFDYDFGIIVCLATVGYDRVMNWLISEYDEETE